MLEDQAGLDVEVVELFVAGSVGFGARGLGWSLICWGWSWVDLGSAVLEEGLDGGGLDFWLVPVLPVADADSFVTTEKSVVNVSEQRCGIALTRKRPGE